MTVSEADAEGGEEVHEEGAVEILAELVQHKPGNIVCVRSG